MYLHSPYKNHQIFNVCSSLYYRIVSECAAPRDSEQQKYFYCCTCSLTFSGMTESAGILVSTSGIFSFTSNPKNSIPTFFKNWSNRSSMKLNEVFDHSLYNHGGTKQVRTECFNYSTLVEEES